MAAPTPYPSDETLEQLIGLVNGGAPLPLACQAVGLRYPTIQRWLNLGRDGDERYVSLYDRISRAKGMWASAATLRVHESADRDWKAAAWLLERRLPKYFSTKPMPSLNKPAATDGIDAKVLADALEVVLAAKKSGAL